MVELLLEVEILENEYEWDDISLIVGKRYPVKIVNDFEFEFESEKDLWDDGFYSTTLNIPHDYDPTTYRIICKGVKCIGKNE
ncbi:hypothetical protein PHRODO_120 [Bacillus phage Phrodo]|uniref:hypothetical protein n=1 Tax=Bacillus phage Phrodo TaxID=1805953 RepID=UPI0007A77386|nr:hypothetical protein BI003_gp120 [Bacillus phage Phrodo]AMW62161.1 hypothetical protein PHRODO_120 [Bacillus phage Phrodo]UGO48931.1 hypothetical protein JARJAR_117 [Bacillus phage vB_BanH_JarJar]UGO50422.1 hypothetical protein RONSWANSON_116 [Bacillus phage vB_BanH_RonSwanson]